VIVQTPQSLPDSRRLPPAFGERLFISDGGLETTLIFDHGLELPCFAAFPLLADDAGRTLLRDYFAPFLAIAKTHGTGFVLDTATWRANPDWGARLGFDSSSLAEINRASVELAQEVRAGAGGEIPIAVNGVIGPRGEGYNAADVMAPADAQRYHAQQIKVFAQAEVDMVTALTLTHTDEAVGVVRAASEARLPVAVSFTVETDGRLPSGQPLGAAIEQVDADTDGAAAFFMINCAHPIHFSAALSEGGEWRRRIVGIRANASRKSHAELDESDELDRGDPGELATQYKDLCSAMPSVMLVGGCCGTDHRHVAAICAALTRAPALDSRGRGPC
jgi:S-methylmethionine-dependent homocysteine/selenocysteine methylase